MKSTHAAEGHLHRNSVRDWAELVRAPNTFTVIADIFAGYAIATGTLRFHLELLVAVLASISLYWSGMVLNDVHDVEADRSVHRGRPLSDGRISIVVAMRVGFVLLFAGCLLAGLVGWSRVDRHWDGDSLLFAVLLAISIVAYDSRWKSTMIGPFLMGLCRGLNLLLGMSAGAAILQVDWVNEWWWGLAPLAHTIYVAGFTLAARREAVVSRRGSLLCGWTIAVLGIVVWILVPGMAQSIRRLHLDPGRWYPILVGMLCLPWLRRVYDSVQSLQPKSVQLAIKQSILTLIFLDAAATLAFAGPIAGIVTCLLVVPMAVLGLWFRST